ncbi:MAG: SsrA-binding protein SmpB [Dehalococcoidia bacterium]|nr:SsrA-binding protein SmpB [Dehalococcoidia bacterium]MDD5493881.1 SsrA-binding protein SmpB [Dehalococcoidia bacterium]
MESTKPITVNKKAYHDYHILESYEAGIVLKGSEIKSIRAGRVNIRDAYARPDNGELWLYNSHIATYQAASHDTHQPDRRRKLLMHRKQIAELAAQTDQKGLTLIPLRLYIKDGVAKLELGLGRGKRQFDKRAVIAKRDTEREVERAMKSRPR